VPAARCVRTYGGLWATRYAMDTTGYGGERLSMRCASAPATSHFVPGPRGTQFAKWPPMWVHDGPTSGSGYGGGNQNTPGLLHEVMRAGHEGMDLDLMRARGPSRSLPPSLAGLLPASFLAVGAAGMRGLFLSLPRHVLTYTLIHRAELHSPTHPHTHCGV
jgi:hypothetical protein